MPFYTNDIDYLTKEKIDNNLIIKKYKKKDKKIFIFNIDYKYPNSITSQFSYFINNIFVDEIKYKQKKNIFKYKIKINIIENKKIIKILKEMDKLIYNKGKEEFGENIKYKPLIKDYTNKDFIEYLKKNPNKTGKEILDDFKVYYTIILYLNESDSITFNKELLSNNLIKLNNIYIIPECYIKFYNKLKLKNYCYSLEFNDKKYIDDCNCNKKYYYDDYDEGYDDFDNEYKYILKK